MQALQCPLPLVAGDLRSRCEEEWPAYVSRGGNDLPRPILFFDAAKENGFACYGRGGNDLPRPILIFVVAKKNGFACRTSLPLGCIDS